MAPATDRKLAWLVLAILACVALIGFTHGLKGALAGPRILPGETAGAVATAAGAPARDAATGLPLDEARVHEIAREEADAALARARPAAPRRPRPAAQDDADDADEPQAAAPVTPLTPPVATPPAAPQDQPSNPDVQ